jgi:hypothetical protein
MRIAITEIFDQLAPQEPANRVEGMIVIGIPTAILEAQQGNAEETLNLNEPVAPDRAVGTTVFAVAKELHFSFSSPVFRIKS